MKAKRFKRILFLVDRNALGVQAQDVFKEVKLESLQTLDQIYNIKELTDKLIDAETAVHVATVQGMMKCIMYAESEDRIPAVSDYDLIIIDEAHRGYIWIRKWRRRSSFIATSAITRASIAMCWII